ncbi:MAG: hypothetical protein ABIV63_09495 [Caldimonas sp.]
MSSGLAFEPRQVLLFSGHRVDAPGRVPARFPASKVAAATAAIDAAIDRLDVGAADLALTQGSAGGDLLFAEACLRRGARLELLLPTDESHFIEESVRDADDGDRWVERYRAVRVRLQASPRVLQADPLRPDADRFERCNEWLLDTAFAWGAGRVHFICLWDGGAGDGPGGTAHFVDEVRRRDVPVVWLDVRRL